MNSPPEGPFQVGSRVRIPWGLDEVEGQVEAVYGTGDRAKLAISFLVPESDDIETLTLPARLAELVSEDDEPVDPVGHWLQEYRFWEQVAHSVGEILSNTGTQVNSQLHLAGGRSDVVARTPDGVTVLIECKATIAPRASQVQLALVHLDSFARDVDTPTAGLLVLQGEMSEDVRQNVEKAAKRSRIPFSAVTWRGPQDNRELRRAFDFLVRVAGPSSP